MSRNNALVSAAVSAALAVTMNTPVSRADTPNQPDFPPAIMVLQLIEEQQNVLKTYILDATRQASRNYEARKQAEAAEAARLAAEAARLAAEAEARRPKRVRPAEGVLTSGFGARWGTMHQGVDIANAIGTPIRSAADGVVIEAGPAQGFGLWTRVRHDDGIITVYGHVDRFTAPVGKRVLAGDEIAKMGNRGQSTGPHLHFEVWRSGKKINPLGWLL